MLWDPGFFKKNRQTKLSWHGVCKPGWAKQQKWLLPERCSGREARGAIRKARIGRASMQHPRPGNSFSDALKSGAAVWARILFFGG